MKLLKKLLFLSAAFFLFSCGLEEYKYIPQVPQGNILRINNTEATINMPSLQDNSTDPYYTIFYRIYISGENISSEIQTSSEFLNNISPDLSRDFSAIFPSTDPTNTTGTSVNTLFYNRNYYELEFDGADIKSILTKNGGMLRIRFPTELSGIPTATFSGIEYRISRSGELISPLPVNDLFFRNTSDLNNPTNAAPNINADVAGRSGISRPVAYVSMYIAAAGLDDVTFSPVYSKPTHISIFKLPDAN